MGDAPAPLQTTLAAQPPKVDVPLWVRASWLAPVVGIAGNMLVTTSVTSQLKGTSVGHLGGVLLSVFWSLFIATGLVLGIASVIAAAIRRRPRWALHGGIGVALGSLLIVWALAAWSASRGRDHLDLDAGAAPTHAAVDGKTERPPPPPTAEEPVVRSEPTMQTIIDQLFGPDAEKASAAELMLDERAAKSAADANAILEALARSRSTGFSLRFNPARARQRERSSERRARRPSSTPIPRSATWNRSRSRSSRCWTARKDFSS